MYPQMPIEDFIAQYARPYDPETDNYSRPPFATDTKAARSGKIYDAHSYHTKVPPQGIIPYIEHYTQPGDLLLDPFCGSGMTGVAALTCPTGPRRVILNDLSPAACHIAYNYCTPVDVQALKTEFERIKQAGKEEFDWLYGTTCHKCGSPATIQYTIWSDVFQCGKCGKDIILWHAAVDHVRGTVMETFRCPHCDREWRKRDLKHLRNEPVVTNFLCSRPRCGRHEHAVTGEELERLKEIEAKEIPYWYPTTPFDTSWEMWRAVHRDLDITDVSRFYTRRNLWALARLWDEFGHVVDDRLRSALQFIFTSMCAIHATMMTRVIFKGGSKPVLTGNMPGTLYFPSISVEKNLMAVIERKGKDAFEFYSQVSTPHADDIFSVVIGSATQLSIIPNNSIDYIFTDPPFGSNIFYADCNLLMESWLGRLTDERLEAVIHVKCKDKNGVSEYKRLMTESFHEMHRVLKPNRWASVVFHNSDDAIWRVIQDAAQAAGFDISNALYFDKQQRSFKGVRGEKGLEDVTNFDIVLNLHKRPPTNGIAQSNGDVDALALDAIVTHLRTSPPPEHRAIEFLHSLSIRKLLNTNVKVERVTIPYLEVLLPQYGFKQVDGRWYLRSEDVVAFGKLGLSIEDETTAIQWLRNHLQREPQTRGEIDPHWKIATLNVRLSKDLDQILAENFWQDEMTGMWRIPTDEERVRMEEAAQQTADRALRRLLNDLESKRALSSLPNSSALAQWIRDCTQRERWREIILLFPLLNRSDFSPEEWFELQNDHRYAVQQSEQTVERQKPGQRTLRLAFDEGDNQ